MNPDLRSEDPRIEMLARAASAIPVAPLDVGGVVRAARSRRRRAITVVASAAAVVVIGAGVALVAPDRNRPAPGPVDRADSGDATGEPASPLPPPPAGTKWVGQDGVLVAVPSDWAVTEHPCGVDAVALVFDGTVEPIVGCVSQGGQVATVRFDPVREDSRDSPAVCSTSVPGRCSESRVFDDGEMAAEVTVTVDERSDTQLVDRILDSAIAVPEGWTTVPFGWGSRVRDRLDALAAEGLKVEVIDRERINNVEALLSPKGGTVVEVGTTVTLAPIDTRALDLTCAPVDQVNIDLDVPGPGRPTPAQAAAPFSDGLALTTQVGPGPLRSGRQAEVEGTDTGGVVQGVFGVTERNDGWWPDSYRACRTPVLADEASNQDGVGATDLAGAWKVHALIGRDGQSLLKGRYADALSLTFNDGTMTGSSGCNSVFGTYVQGGRNSEDMSFPREKLGSSLIDCDEPPLLQRLTDVRHVSGKGDVRYLHATNWMIVAELRRP